MLVLIPSSTYIPESDSVKLLNKIPCHVICWWLPLYKNHAVLQGKHPTYPGHDHPMNFCSSPSSKSQNSCVLQLNLCPLSEAVPSCDWTLSLVHSRPRNSSLQVSPSSWVKYLIHCRTSTMCNSPSPMKTLSHQPTIHPKLSRPCQSTQDAPIATHYDKPPKVHPQGWKPATQHTTMN
jgi:hypothetical protein